MEEINTNLTPKNSHAGHRQRLKDKVRKNGLKILSDHEILELLLTYSIPFKNTNDTAHLLMNKFGSLPKVIDAGYDELKATKGIGEETALFLNILSQFINTYGDLRCEDNKVIFHSTCEFVKYFRSNFKIRDKEYMYVFLLSKNLQLLTHFTMEGSNDAEIELRLKDFINQINFGKVYSVLIVHTHPNGEVAPSEADLNITRRIIYCCAMIGIKLVDHIIINDDTYFSFSRSKIVRHTLQNISKEYFDDKAKFDIDNFEFYKFLEDE